MIAAEIAFACWYSCTAADDCTKSDGITLPAVLAALATAVYKLFVILAAALTLFIAVDSALAFDAFATVDWATCSCEATEAKELCKLATEPAAPKAVTMLVKLEKKPPPVKAPNRLLMAVEFKAFLVSAAADEAFATFNTVPAPFAKAPILAVSNEMAELKVVNVETALEKAALFCNA